MGGTPEEGSGEAMKVGPHPEAAGARLEERPELGALGVQAAVWSGRSGSGEEGLFGNKTEAAGYVMVPRRTHLML